MTGKVPFELAAELFRALGQETRLRLLAALSDGECSVGELEGRTGIGQPGLSQQLAVLRKAGLITPRRAAKLVYYRIEAKAFEPVQKLLARITGERREHGAWPSRRPASRTKRGGAATFAKIV